MYVKDSIMFKFYSIKYYKIVAIKIYTEGKDAMDILIDTNRVMQIQKMLRDRDISFEVTPSSLSGSRNRSPVLLSPRPRSPRKPSSF